MTPNPSTDSLLDLTQRVRPLEPKDDTEANTLNEVIALLRVLIGSPGLAESVTQATQARAMETVIAKQLASQTVIQKRIDELLKHGRVDATGDRCGRGLKRAWMEFEQAATQARQMPIPEEHASPEQRLRLVRERMEAFDAVEQRIQPLRAGILKLRGGHESGLGRYLRAMMG